MLCREDKACGTSARPPFRCPRPVPIGHGPGRNLMREMRNPRRNQEQMNDEIRAALESIKREFPSWTVSFVGGRRPVWMAFRVFEVPATLVSVECFSARALRGRMMLNEWMVTPRDSLDSGHHFMNG